MRRHPSWDAAPPSSPRGGAHSEQDGSRRTTGAAALPRTGRLRSSSASAHSAVSEIAGFFTPEEVTKSTAAAADASLWLGFAGSDSSSVSSGVASPVVPYRSTSHTTGTSSNVSVTGTATTMVEGTAAASAGASGKVKKKRVRIKTERRREQCRRNQARYRNKQKLSAHGLESSVEQLRLEVEQLRQQHESLHREPVPVPASSGDLITETLRVFRFGLNVGRDASLLAMPHRELPPLEHQIAFVSSVFHPDLLVGDMRGRMHLLEQLRRYSTLFNDLEIIPDPIVPRTRPESSNLVHATCRVDVTVSTTTLRSVFPHLVRAEHHELRWKLLGQRLRCAAALVLVLNHYGHVVEISWTIDWIAALQAVLTIEETAVVLQNAQIDKDAYLLVSGEEPPGREVPPPTRSASRFMRWDEPVRREAKQDEEEEDYDGDLLHDGQGDNYILL